MLALTVTDRCSLEDIQIKGIWFFVPNDKKGEILTAPYYGEISHYLCKLKPAHTPAVFLSYNKKLIKLARARDDSYTEYPYPNFGMDILGKYIPISKTDNVNYVRSHGDYLRCKYSIFLATPKLDNLDTTEFITCVINNNYSSIDSIDVIPLSN